LNYHLDTRGLIGFVRSSLSSAMKVSWFGTLSILLGASCISSGFFLRPHKGHVKDFVKKWLDNGGTDILRDIGVISALEKANVDSEDFEGAPEPYFDLQTLDEKPVVDGFIQASSWGTLEDVRAGATGEGALTQKKFSYVPDGEGVKLVEPGVEGAKEGWVDLLTWSLVDDSEEANDEFDQMIGQGKDQISGLLESDDMEIEEWYEDSDDWKLEKEGKPQVQHFDEGGFWGQLEEEQAYQLTGTDQFEDFGDDREIDPRLNALTLEWLGDEEMPSFGELTDEVSSNFDFEFEDNFEMPLGNPRREMDPQLLDFAFPFPPPPPAFQPVGLFDPWEEFTVTLLQRLNDQPLSSLDEDTTWTTISIIDIVPSDGMEESWEDSGEDLTIGELLELMEDPEETTASSLIEFFPFVQPCTMMWSSWSWIDSWETETEEAESVSDLFGIVGIREDHAQITGHIQKQPLPVLHANTPSKMKPPSRAHQHTGLHSILLGMCVFAAISGVAFFVARRHKRKIQMWQKAQFQTLHEPLVANAEIIDDETSA